jgi:hypothetical protein
LIAYYEIQLTWLSPKTKRQEMVFARDLTHEQTNSLLGRIFNYQDWSELKSFIEQHEGEKISYIVSGVRRSTNTYVVPIIVSGVKNAK